VGRQQHSSSGEPRALVEDEWGHEYGDELWLVLNGSVVIVKRPPREHDRVSARFKWGDKGLAGKYASQKFREDPRKLLFSQDAPRWGHVCEVRPTMRTCLVSHQEPVFGKSDRCLGPATGAGGDHGIAKMWKRREISASSCYDRSHELPPRPYYACLKRPGVRACVRADQHGKPSYTREQLEHVVEYRLAELVVDSRAAPRYQVVGELGQVVHLRKHPTPEYGPDNSEGVVDVGDWLYEKGTVADRPRVSSASRPGRFIEFIKVQGVESKTRRAIEGYIIEKEGASGGPGAPEIDYRGLAIVNHGHGADDSVEQPEHRLDCDVHVEDGLVGEALPSCQTVHHEETRIGPF
jgi:hypothetical protein